jgi:hypothetical protein
MMPLESATAQRPTAVSRSWRSFDDSSYQASRLPSVTSYRRGRAAHRQLGPSAGCVVLCSVDRPGMVVGGSSGQPVRGASYRPAQRDRGLVLGTRDTEQSSEISSPWLCRQS